MVDSKYFYILCQQCQKSLQKTEQEEKSIAYACQSCEKVRSLTEMGELNEHILKEMKAF